MASYFKVMQDGREVEFSFYLNNLVVRVPYTNGYFSLVGETSNSIGSVTIVSTKEGVDIPYTVSISDSWLTSETGKIVLSENTGEERRGTVTITQSESNPEEDRPTTLTDAVTIISITPSFDNVYYYRI